HERSQRPAESPAASEERIEPPEAERSTPASHSWSCGSGVAIQPCSSRRGRPVWAETTRPSRRIWMLTGRPSSSTWRASGGSIGVGASAWDTRPLHGLPLRPFQGGGGQPLQVLRGAVEPDLPALPGADAGALEADH